MPSLGHIKEVHINLQNPPPLWKIIVIQKRNETKVAAHMGR